MVNAIIFSFDRASQLHLLLESINKNAKGIFNINVLYKYSNDEFKKGYEILKERFSEINWVEETNFKEQTLKLMETSLEFTCFGVDDDVFFGELREEDAVECMKNEDVICFTPRQGLNTKVCYSMNCENIILPDKEDEKFIWWDRTKRYADAGYSLSLDFHIFRTKEIKKMIKNTIFSNPNTLEGGLQIFDEDFPRSTMVAYKQSILVGCPINIVQNFCPNRKGEKFGISAKELNDRYLNGEIIDFDKIDFSNINSAHCELKLEFKKP